MKQLSLWAVMLLLVIGVTACGGEKPAEPASPDGGGATLDPSLAEPGAAGGEGPTPEELAAQEEATRAERRGEAAPEQAPAEPAAPEAMAPEAAAPAAMEVTATITAKFVAAGDGHALEVIEAKGADGNPIPEWAGVTLAFASPEASQGLAANHDLMGKTLTVTGKVNADAKTIVVESHAEVAAAPEAGPVAVDPNAVTIPTETDAAGSESGRRR
ncbi:MAG: hypothetical protein AMXMBFR84_40960 [Candidatus Hydrogenedentota bacterium]